MPSFDCNSYFEAINYGLDAVFILALSYNTKFLSVYRINREEFDMFGI